MPTYRRRGRNSLSAMCRKSNEGAKRSLKGGIMSEIDDLHKSISNKIYEQLLKELEDWISTGTISGEALSLHLDNIIKIKTIKYMDLQTEILEASRRVSRN